jgi:hypothetical protein
MWFDAAANKELRTIQVFVSFRFVSFRFVSFRFDGFDAGRPLGYVLLLGISD